MLCRVAITSVPEGNVPGCRKHRENPVSVSVLFCTTWSPRVCCRRPCVLTRGCCVRRRTPGWFVWHERSTALRTERPVYIHTQRTTLLTPYWLTETVQKQSRLRTPASSSYSTQPCRTNFQGHSFKILLTHPLPSIIYFPLHVIRLSCLGSERPHGLHVLSHAPKCIAPLLTTP